MYLRINSVKLKIMETNFFKSIRSLEVSGNWKINIAKEKDDVLIVSVLLYNDSIGDDARKKVPPILLKGTAEELDEGFFKAVQKPVEKTNELFANMEAFLKGQEEAKIASQMHKESALKQEKKKTEKQKFYEQGMKKAEELEAEGKYKEAWMKVPPADHYPEHKEAIQKRKAEISDKFPADLFNEPNTQQPC